MRSTNFAVGALVPSVACILLLGCDDGLETVDLRDPNEIHPLDAGTDATPTPPPEVEAGNCPGMCAPLAPLGEDGWSTPLLLWFGPKEQAPACPASASDRRWEGYADLDAPLDCPACSCSPPTGSCVLPEKLTAADATCPAAGAGVNYTPFDPPASWDGSCTTAGAISAGSGVRSLTFGPLQVVEDGCTSSLEGKPPPKLPPPTWKTYAFACDAQQGMPPCKNGLFCMPATPPSGFRACLFHKGELASCPKSYPEAHVFYPEDSVTDTRACGGCACGAPWGSDCMSLVSVYNDDACKDVQATIMVTSQPGVCVSVMPAGAALGSKSAAEPIYLPGTCLPRTSAPTGAATPAEPSTFCCEGETGSEPRSRSGRELFDSVTE